MKGGRLEAKSLKAHHQQSLQAVDDLSEVKPLDIGVFAGDAEVEAGQFQS